MLTILGIILYAIGLDGLYAISSSGDEFKVLPVAFVLFVLIGTMLMKFPIF